MSGYNNTAIALFLFGTAILVVVAPVVHHIKQWHLKRIESGRRGLEAWHIIAVGIVGAWLFMTIIGAGAIYSLAKKASVAAPASSAVVTGPTTSAATAYASVSTAEADKGPVEMLNYLAIEGGPPMGLNVFSLRFKGTNSSQKEVTLKSASLISAINGTKIPVEIAAGTEILSVNQVEMLPPGTQFELVAKFGPPDPNNPGKILGLDPKVFLETWRQFTLNVEDDTRPYRVPYNETNLAPLFPGIIGPHVTKKQEAK